MGVPNTVKLLMGINFWLSLTILDFFLVGAVHHSKYSGTAARGVNVLPQENDKELRN